MDVGAPLPGLKFFAILPMGPVWLIIAQER